MFFFKKTTHSAVNLKNECTGTLKYTGSTIKFALLIILIFHALVVGSRRLVFLCFLSID